MKNKKYILVTSLMILMVCLVWFWMFYITQPTTKDNSYEKQIHITKITAQFAYHRGTDLLTIATKDDSYIINTKWRNEEKTAELIERIRSLKEPVNVCVWEHFPKYIFRSGNVIWCKEIVEIEGLSSDLVSISKHNSYQNNERIAGIIGVGCFFSIPVILSIILFWWLQYKPKKRNICRRRRTQ